MTTHHEAAQDNIREVIAGLDRVNSEPMNYGQANAAYTAKLVIATLANTQALLAINETLQVIASAAGTPTPIAICPSRYSNLSNHRCMLPLGHATKHESPERATW